MMSAIRLPPPPTPTTIAFAYDHAYEIRFILA